MKKGYLVHLYAKDNEGWFTLNIIRYGSKAMAQKVADSYAHCPNFKAIVETM